MRNQTRSLITVATLGLLAASYQMGTAAEVGLSLGAAAPTTTSGTSGSTAPATPPPGDAAAGSSSPSAAPTTSASAAPTATSGSTATSAPAATPKASAKPAATKAPAAVATAKTIAGPAIDYKYGTVQLEVTKTGAKITDVNVLVGYGSQPQYTTLIASLAQYAVAANGSNFGNVTRATFTTNAFKQALDSTLAKF